MVTQALLKKITDTIVEKIHPQRIYLFGSQAMGTATPDSDIDLVVVADVPGNRRERNREIRRLFRGRTFGLDVFVLSPDEFDHQKRLISSIGYIAETQGKVLYERT